MKIFDGYQIRDLTLKNRIVMPPMCMYMSKDGCINPDHLVHYVTRAAGGVGLIIVEATAVSPEGLIEPGDLGIWNDEQAASFIPLVKQCHQYGAKMALQIAHAGRKSFDAPHRIAPSPIAYNDSYGMIHELSKQEITQKIDDFRTAALRAVQAGFDMVEVHAAHGYLIHEFLSPLTNKRTDEFGGSIENRVRFLKTILEEIKKYVPSDFPIGVRVSASDYTEGGIDIHEMVRMIDHVKGYVDIVHVSSGGLTETPVKYYPGYQVEFSRIIKERCGIPTIAVGLINNPDMVDEILENGRADLVALGRSLLRDPYWVLGVAHKNGINSVIPTFYEMGFK